MAGSKLFNDRTGPLVISPGRPLAMSHWVYVDHLGMICLSEVELQKTNMGSVVQHLNSIGLTIHEIESCAAETKRLDAVLTASSTRQSLQWSAG